MSCLNEVISRLDCEQSIQQLLLSGGAPTLLGDFLAKIAIPQEIVDDILAIPSEVSTEERRLLFSFFAHCWEGQKNVLELGPFIGGTTRPIGLGMAANQNRNPNVKLYSYDLFTYRSGESLVNFLEPLFASGQLNAEMKPKLLESNDVFSVYQALHNSTQYAPFLHGERRCLPNQKEDMYGNDALMMLDPSMEFDSVFVDASKTWFSMKYFLMEIAKVTKPGAVFFYQDYGWFTCYWLPIACALLGDTFKLRACMFTSYIFELTAPLDSSVIAKVIPDSLEELDSSLVDQILNDLTAQAASHGDTFGRLGFQLQRAVISAKRGDFGTANSIIEEASTTAADPWFKMLWRAHMHVKGMANQKS